MWSRRGAKNKVKNAESQNREKERKIYAGFKIREVKREKRRNKDNGKRKEKAQTQR